jgi:hypothetical protein
MQTKRRANKTHFVFPDLLEPIDDSEMADADAGRRFFFFTFLFEPSRLNDPDAVAVFFSRGGVSGADVIILKYF